MADSSFLEEANAAPPKAPKTGSPPLQIGGVTAPPRGAPRREAPRPAPPPQQGGMFPGGPVPPPESAGLPWMPEPGNSGPPGLGPPAPPAGPPGIAPPSSALSAFLPPNYQAQLGSGGFFSGPGSVPGGGIDPMEWLKQLFGGMVR